MADGISTEYVTAWNFETDVVTKNLTLHAKWVKEYEITREMLDEAVREARKYKEEDYTEDSYKLLEQKSQRQQISSANQAPRRKKLPQPMTN